MAIDFPGSPSVNDTFTSGSLVYTFDGTKWTAEPAGVTGGTKIEVSNTKAEIIDTGTDGRFVVTTEGSERLRVTSTGLMGLGTASPDALLTVSGVGAFGAGAAGTPSIARSSDLDTGFWFPEANTLAASTGGSERLRVDSSGRLLVGTSTARANVFNGAIVPSVQIEGTSFAQTTFSIVRNENIADSRPGIVLGKTRGASNGSNTVVQSGDNLGLVDFQGADGANLVSAARIDALVDGTPGTNDMPGRLVFSTTADGASSPTERLRIAQNGQFEVRNSSNFIPITDNTVSFGANSFRWSAIWAANGTIQTSDERTKADIADAQLGTDFIKELRPVSYKWIEGGKRDTGERDENNNYIYESVPGTRTHWGFIAQEVKQAVDAAGVDFGGWVLTDKDDPDSQQALRYDQFIAPLTKALQEAIGRIETLEAKVTALESQQP